MKANVWIIRCCTKFNDNTMFDVHVNQSTNRHAKCIPIADQFPTGCIVHHFPYPLHLKAYQNLLTKITNYTNLYP